MLKVVVLLFFVGSCGRVLSQSERLLQLNRVAIAQMKSLLQSSAMKRLK